MYGLSECRKWAFEGELIIIFSKPCQLLVTETCPTPLSYPKVLSYGELFMQEVIHWPLYKFIIILGTPGYFSILAKTD